MSLFHRRVAIVSAGVLATAGLVVASPSAGPVGAAETTTNVTFKDCEVRELDPVNQRIKDNVTWATPVRLNLPTPVRAGVEVTAESALGSLPADLIPHDLTEVRLDSSVTFGVDGRSDLWFASYSVDYPPYDASEPFPLEELEMETYWPEAGIYVHRPKGVEYTIQGYEGENYYRYRFSCDNLIDPPEALTVAIYDPSATPAVTLDRYAARQGQRINVVGQHLLGTAPTTPAANAVVTVGGLSVGSYPIDQSGAFAAQVVIPAYTAPGTVQVRVANGARSATTQLQVTAVKGKVTAAPKVVKKGKAVKLTGRSFKPGETVRLTLKGGRGAGKKAFSTRVKVKTNGTFAKAVKLRKSAKGAWRVTASGSASKRIGRTSFKVR